MGKENIPEEKEMAGCAAEDADATEEDSEVACGIVVEVDGEEAADDEVPACVVFQLLTIIPIIPTAINEPPNNSPPHKGRFACTTKVTKSDRTIIAPNTIRTIPVARVVDIVMSSPPVGTVF